MLLDLHKPIITKFKKRTVYSIFKEKIWGADVADMQLITKSNTGFRFLWNVIDIFMKYSWVVPLKHKKGYTITNASQKILKESKLNKILVDQENEFCNNSVKNWLKDNDIEMYKWMID